MVFYFLHLFSTEVDCPVTMPTEPESWTYSPVPAESQRLYRMCWQLENWLRTIVYVELRANQVDWENAIRRKAQDWPPRSLSNDKDLHHMATPHQAALSYLTFGQLWDVVSSTEHWELFAPYFPPKDNAQVRIAEVKAIRNRTAHFREPHSQDTARLELFMRDMESGIRRFCTRYTAEKVPSDPAADAVSNALEQDWDYIGYGIELMRPHGWLYAPGAHRMDPLMNAQLDMLTHKNYSAGSLQGVIYRVTLHPGNRRDRPSDTVGIFNRTKSLHQDIIHFIVSAPGGDVSVTIPAIHGTEKTAELVAAFLRAGLEATRGHHPPMAPREKLEWPEYVLWPDHMLAIFCDKIQEPILDLE